MPVMVTVWTTLSAPNRVAVLVQTRCPNCGLMVGTPPSLLSNIETLTKMLPIYCDETCYRAHRPQDFYEYDEEVNDEQG